jgi:uncharacterized protein
MIIVSDTSALTSLIQVRLEQILPRLFQAVVIPEAVELELRRAHTELPLFLKVVRVTERRVVERLARELDLGEAEAIALILEGHGDLLLIDERKGRRLAAQEGIRVIGLLGVLLKARRHGLINSLRQVLRSLQREAGFRISEALMTRLLNEAKEE